MSILEAIILGIVQGLTEFLPVSSSGHLQIAKEILGITINDNIAFDITLHAATVLSTIVILWSEVKYLFKGLFMFQYNEQTKYVLKILLSMIPVGIVGVLLKDPLNEMLSSPAILAIVGAMLLVTALLLLFAYKAKPRDKASISYRDAMIIGLSQAVATMPGLSRSGTTISTGLILGNQKVVVAEFSFLMVLLPIMGESLLELLGGGLLNSGIDGIALAAGFIASFVTGCLACRFMINIIKKGKLIWFSAYCAVAGLVSILCYIF
ncbi:MAG: undecaprenyl-diphosphate phosphatase [Tidjanibacter sp.]|nr:undecaprenyl-diphosphate phosphatase [Tidjanibacter sp.]